MKSAKTFAILCVIGALIASGSIATNDDSVEFVDPPAYKFHLAKSEDKSPKAPAAKSFGTENKIDFNRDVRPILSNHCFVCHGPDKKAREAGLRLDRRENVDFEEVQSRISSDDSSERMPPSHTNKPLNAKQISILNKWINQGAKYDIHWSFRPISNPKVPEKIHPIDYFVDRALDQRALKRSKRAEPAVLVRRLYLDLIGLPPPLEVVEQFEANPTAQAYEALVDKLLQSPRYGERWARRWLDLARYADTNGFEKDRDRSIWPYRDWVIRALNEDLPFDQFTIEQLAGDMLPNATESQRIATGFHRNTMLNEEGGIDPLEYRYYALVDRIATTGTTWLGLTLGCAQCHTHKFDPITHQEYFSLMAYFNNADEPQLFLQSKKHRDQRANDLRQAQTLIGKLEKSWPANSKSGKDLKSAFANWKAAEKDNLTPWTTIAPVAMSTNLPFLQLEKNNVIFARGDTTKHDTYRLKFSPQKNQITAIRLEALPDPRLPGGGPGMTYYEGTKGDFFLAEFTLKLEDGTPFKWGRITETYAKNRFGKNPVSARLATDGDFQSGWSIAGRLGTRQAAVFNLARPIPAGKAFTIVMEFGRHYSSSLGKFRLSVANERKAINASTLTDSQAKWLSASDPSSKQKLLRHFLMRAAPVQKQADRIRNLLKTNRGVSTLVMQERNYSQQRKNHIYHRGEFTQPKELVSVGIPEVLIGKNRNKMPQNRLEFARWVVSKNNPLTARVVANRHWAAFFGTGLVPTLGDFGMQGSPPSHPELLDFLASTLIKNRWSLKKLHRLIVTSQTYQQTSVLSASQQKQMVWLPAFPRRRLEAEIIRDTALQAAGILNLKMFGPPVRPVQPAGAAANFQKSVWRPSPGRERFRRSIYTYQKRTAPFAMFMTFDGTSGESCIAKRNISNTPLQALTLMNDPMFMEIAKAFGQRMDSENELIEKKIEIGFRRLLTRKPDPAELQMLKLFYVRHRDWTAVARVLLCLDEAITKN